MKKIFAFLTLITSGLILGGCCDEDFIVPDYNFIEYAFDVSSFVGGCSDDEAFSTIGATADGQAGECWFNNGPLHNRWFQFTAATSAISIEIQVGGDYGTQRRTNGVLWDSEGTEIDCEPYYCDDCYLYLYSTGLTIGQVYYFSVDVEDSGSVGTFTVCIYDTF
jgi:hypothetical protein